MTPPRPSPARDGSGGPGSSDAGDPGAAPVGRGARLHRRGAQSLHEQIEQILRAQIASGELPPNHKLPPEPELAEEFGVNRGTLRRALAPLVASGLLTSHRGRGTFVAGRPPQTSIGHRFLSLSEDLASQGHPVSRRLLSANEGSLPPRVGGVLGCESGLILARVFNGPDGPIAYLRNYVRGDLCAGLAQIDFAVTPLFEALADRCAVTITRGRRTFGAVAASSDVAAALGVALRSPVLHIEQVSFAGDAAVEYSDVFLDSGTVSVTSMLDRI